MDKNEKENETLEDTKIYSSEKRKRPFFEKTKVFWEKLYENAKKYAKIGGKRTGASFLFGASAFTAAAIVFCLFLTLVSGVTLGVLSLVFGFTYIAGFLEVGLFEIGAATAFLGISLLFFTLLWQAAKKYTLFLKNDMKRVLKNAFKREETVKIYDKESK